MPVNRLVPYATYVNDSTPSPNAEFLNEWLQGGLAGLIGGTLTHYGISIDGVGDQTVVPVAGQLRIDGKAAEGTASVVFADSTSAPGVGVGYNLRFQTPANGVGRVRLYEIRGGWVETTNAAWTGNVGAEWARDAAGNATMRVLTAGTTVLYGIVTPGATWASAAWVASMSTDVAGNLYGGKSVEAASGNLVANGTPVGSAGPGLVKAVRQYSTGTALAIGDVVPGANWGVGATTAAIAGTDSACLVTIAAAGVPVANPTFVFTYKQLTWTTAPIVDVVLKNATDATGVGMPVTWTVTPTTVTVVYYHTPVAAQSYEFVIKSSGY